MAFDRYWRQILHYLANVCENLSIRCRGYGQKVRFPIWRPSAILNFSNVDFWTHNFTYCLNLRQRTKCHQIWQGFIEMWRFSTYSGRLPCWIFKRLRIFTLHLLTKFRENRPIRCRVINKGDVFIMPTFRHLEFKNISNHSDWLSDSVYRTNHRLRGSASPVLTATHHSYGSPRLSDFFQAHAWRSDPQPILTENGSNDVDSRKDDTFAVKIATFHTP